MKRTGRAAPFIRVSLPVNLARSMRTLLLLDPTQLRRWHAWLISALAARGVHLAVHLNAGSEHGRPLSLTLLLEGERLLSRGRTSACDAVGAGDLGVDVLRGALPAGSFDVVMDLTGRASAAACPDAVCVQPLIDGAPGETALWAALLGHRAPRIDLAIAGYGVRALAAPAIEHPHQIRASADQVLSRLVEGLVSIGTRGLAGLPAAPSHRGGALSGGRVFGALAPLAFGWDKVAQKAQRVLARRRGTEPRWRVGWRIAPEGRPHLGALPPLSAYTVLEDDGARYYADPFVWTVGDVHHVFVEELPLATGRGLISHFTVEPDGRGGAPRPVLETAHHLSYPQIFAHDGQIYMMPECSASGALDIYRADPFPTRWRPVFRLLDEELHDATLVAHQGRFYILASKRAFASSSWDALHVYSADRLEGPWLPLPGNPVLVDRTASRSAGVLYRMEDALWRPAQDCSGGYGSALTLARVTRLDREGFAQEPAGNLRLEGAAAGPHTVNVSGPLELLDFLA